jgi:hypothetical protein
MNFLITLAIILAVIAVYKTMKDKGYINMEKDDHSDIEDAYIIAAEENTYTSWLEYIKKGNVFSIITPDGEQVEIKHMNGKSYHIVINTKSQMAYPAGSVSKFIGEDDVKQYLKYQIEFIKRTW